MPQENTLGRLNDVLFAELDALRAVDPADAEALAAEVERSKAVQGVAGNIVSNARTIMEATRMRAEYMNTATVPRLLEG